MMMIGLVKELSGYVDSKPRLGMSSLLRKLKLTHRPGILSYFFCQSTDSRLNSAVSVLKGLIYLLIAQHQNLIRHLQKRYDDAGRKIFEGPIAVYTLRTILLDMLTDSTLPRTYLLVDALDECTDGLHVLLDIIAGKGFTTRLNVKWLVSSRNRPDIKECLRPDSWQMKISLELNPTHISRAVATFINTKVKDLAMRKQYDTGLQEEVKNQLYEKAEATFLWVALACKQLGEVPLWRTRSVLKELPSGLEPLYEQMMGQILLQNAEDVEYCKQVLRSVIITYRPLHLQELAATAELPRALFDSISSLSQLVDRCGLFLTVRKRTVYFHPSVSQGLLHYWQWSKDLSLQHSRRASQDYLLGIGSYV
jgi:hypothetical protein